MELDYKKFVYIIHSQIYMCKENDLNNNFIYKSIMQMQKELNIYYSKNNLNQLQIIKECKGFVNNNYTTTEDKFVKYLYNKVINNKMQCYYNNKCKEKARAYYPSGLVPGDKNYEIIYSCTIHKPTGWNRLEVKSKGL
jgi:hypothetical protein